MKSLTGRKIERNAGHSTSNGEKGPPKEESHKQKEKETTDDESKFIEIFDKVEEMGMLSESSTSKELSHPPK